MCFHSAKKLSYLCIEAVHSGTRRPLHLVLISVKGTKFLNFQIGCPPSILINVAFNFHYKVKTSTKGSTKPSKWDFKNNNYQIVKQFSKIRIICHKCFLHPSYKPFTDEIISYKYSWITKLLLFSFLYLNCNLQNTCIASQHRQLVHSIPRLSAPSHHLLGKINAMGTFFSLRHLCLYQN